MLRDQIDIRKADGLNEDYAHYSRGEAAEVAPGVEEATGNPPRSFADFASAYAEVFSESTAQKAVRATG